MQATGSIEGYPDIMEVINSSPDQLVDTGRVVNPFFALAHATGFPAAAAPELALTDGGLAVSERLVAVVIVLTVIPR